jgi:hypothetical protein
VITYPLTTKNMSTPIKPALNPARFMCNPITRTIAMALSPWMSDLKVIERAATGTVLCDELMDSPLYFSKASVKATRLETCD